MRSGRTAQRVTTHSKLLPEFTRLPAITDWMNVAGGVNCRPGSVDRNSGRWLGETSPNCPAARPSSPCPLRTTISPSDTPTYTPASSLEQSPVRLLTQSSADKVGPRIPIVAVAVPSWYLSLLRFPTTPVTARRPPFTRL